MNRRAAKVALSVIPGQLREDPKADEIALEAFGSLEEAASSYAYLAGFLLQSYGIATGQTAPQAAATIRSHLEDT
jgi:hypothetical protein